MTAAIQLRSVTKSYSRGGEALRVLDELDLDMDDGTFYALMGPSGSGKTTLLNMVGGLDQTDSGLVQVGAEDLAVMDGGELAQWRSEHVGFVFQGFNLLPVLTARENVELPLLLAPLSKRQRRAQAERAQADQAAGHAAQRDAGRWAGWPGRRPGHRSSGKQTTPR